MGNYMELRVWQLANQVAQDMDAASAAMAPGYSELRDQLRRATLSVPTNIAEGADRGTDREFSRFLRIALSSAGEAESLLQFAGDRHALDPSCARQISGRIGIIRRMLRVLLDVVEPPRRTRHTMRRPAAADLPASDPDPATQ